MDNSIGSPTSNKRLGSAAEARRGEDPSQEDASSSDDDMGPALPSAIPKKKRRVLPFEKMYVESLPTSSRYSKSLMHREQISFVTMTPLTNYLITCSTDGIVKFWSKTAKSVEFIKEFKAHQGDIKGVSVSADGRGFATAGADKSIKIFDVINFDLVTLITLDFTPASICWVQRRGSSPSVLAVSDEDSPKIRFYDGESQSIKHVILTLHRNPVTIIAYNPIEHTCISVDDGGMIEYWNPETYEKPDNVFAFKSSTSLFCFKKAKSVPSSLTVSPNGQRFVTFSFPDRQVRLFDFKSASLIRSYDESLETISAMQQAGTAPSQLSDLEYGRRFALETSLETSVMRNRANITFDESSNFIIYGGLYGTKVINIFVNSLVKTYGAEDSLRALGLALYQGAPLQKGIVTAAMAASSNPLLQDAEAQDPMLIATGSGKVRFYMFTNDTDISKSTRDVQNERPVQANKAAVAEATKAESGSIAVLHTTYGDIHLRLYPSLAPKAVENFVTHSKNGYYNNTIFHRVIRRFMIQCGDPLGDGTGGESIWGTEFADEFSTLKHDRPYTVSMANAGPNSNGSQFFITTEKAPWLDNKHTIFGRAVQGLDVVHKVENARVYKEKPEEDIKIINISIS